jgi:hypothetical protein
MTFSFDPVCDLPDDPETPDVDESQTVYGNAFFTEDVTQIVPLEEEPVTTEGDDANNPNEGAVAVIDFGNNLTYADARIEAKTSGGGGGNKGGSGGNPNR